MRTTKGSKEQREIASACCDFGSELMVKGAYLENQDPTSLQSQSLSELQTLPKATLIFIFVSLWPNEPDPSTHQSFWVWNSDPGHPGTETYISTQRLRI